MHTHPAPAEFPQADGIQSHTGFSPADHCTHTAACSEPHDSSHHLQFPACFSHSRAWKKFRSSPFCSTQAIILGKTHPGCPTHVICLYYPVIPFRTIQVLCSFFYSLTDRLNKEPTSTCPFLGPRLDHHTKNVSFRRKILSLPLVSH